MTSNVDVHNAIIRLVNVARRDTGQSRIVADFLLAWWNARECGGFDLVDLWSVDEEIRQAMLTVVHYVASSRTYPNEIGYGPQFEGLVATWRPRRGRRNTRRRGGA